MSPEKITPKAKAERQKAEATEHDRGGDRGHAAKLREIEKAAEQADEEAET
jgi:hypothetical protein